MYIDVDSLGIDTQIDEIIGLRIYRYQAVITLQYCLAEIWVLHIASVHHKELERIALAGILRKPYISADTHY